jgi:hypothetical protein
VLLDTCASLAREAGVPNVLAGVNLAREEADRLMRARLPDDYPRRDYAPAERARL